MSFGTINGFDWDTGNWPKCGKHGVSKHDIEGLFHGTAMIFADLAHSKTEERFKAIGQNEFGRHIYVNFTIRLNNLKETLIRPISARFMHQEEIDQYEQS